MAKTVFRPFEITTVTDKVVLKLSKEFEDDEPEAVVEAAPEYTGPTVEDLQHQAEQFQAQWEVEKQRMIDEAKQQADKIIADAETASFEVVRIKTDEANLIHQKAEADANAIIDEAKKNAQNFITEAEQKKEQTIKSAYDEGFKKGNDDGYKSGVAEVERLIERLHVVIEKTMDRRQEILVETEQQIVDLVLLMTRKVVKVLSENQRTIVMQNILQALRKVKGRGDVLIRVNAAELALTTEHTKDFIAAIENVKNISVVEDHTVDKGGCIVETDFGSIDARISSQLAELEQKILEISPIRTTAKTAVKQES